MLLHDGYLHAYRNKDAKASENWFNTDDYLPWLREKLGHDVADIIDTGLDCNSWVARPWVYPEHLHPTNWVVSESIDFLRRRDPTKPFFLMMSFVRPHSPLDPPQYYYDMYIDAEMPDPPIGDWVVQDNDQQDPLVITDLAEGSKGSEEGKGRLLWEHNPYRSPDRPILQAHDENVLNNTVILFTSITGI